MIQYDVIASQPLNHQFTVRLTIPHPSPMGQKLSLPTWIPGSYMIRDFARHIIELKAYTDFSTTTQEIAVEKQNSYTWQIAKHQGPLYIEYSVYAYDTSVRGAYLDDEQAFFNPCSMLLMVHDQEDKPCQVILSAPSLAGSEKWRVATTLTPIDAKPWGYGTYQAANYDELIDKPVQMGQFDLIEFEALGIPHAIAITGQHFGEVKRLAADVKKVCEAQLQLFAKPYPFNRYLFLLNLRKDSYGGLEHRDSTALQIPKEYMPESADAAPTNNYIMLLGLFSHEYFHAWNVKRIKPQSFMPYVLTDKAYTRQLWAFEGITSYYDDLALVRAKVISLEQYLDLISQNLTKLFRNPGRKKQTVLDASFDAWIKFYQPNENTVNSQVSYYLKGSIIALAIDLALRIQTKQQVSLDTIMNRLWLEYGQTETGIPEGKIESMIVELGGEALKALLKQALYTTEDLELSSLLAPFGLILSLRQAQASDDTGGKKATITLVKGAHLGAVISKNQGKVMVAQVLANSSAALAGLSAGDEIVAIEHYKVDEQSYEKILKNMNPNQKITIHVFRQDRLKSLQATLAPFPLDTVEITLKPTLTDTEKSALSSWLDVV